MGHSARDVLRGVPATLREAGWDRDEPRPDGAEVTPLAALMARCKGGVILDINDHRACGLGAEEYLRRERAGALDGTPDAVIARMIAEDSIVDPTFFPRIDGAARNVRHHDPDAAIAEAPAILDREGRA